VVGGRGLVLLVFEPPEQSGFPRGRALENKNHALKGQVGGRFAAIELRARHGMGVAGEWRPRCFVDRLNHLSCRRLRRME
jgi:hypothetical protein